MKAYLFVSLLLLLLGQTNSDNEREGDDPETCENNNNNNNESSSSTALNDEMIHGYDRGSTGGNPLRPSSLPPLQLFSDWTNSTVGLVDREVNVSSGSIRQSGQGGYASHVRVLPKVLVRDEVHRLLRLLRDPKVQLDTDPDTVDGFATQEIFMDNAGLRNGGVSKGDAIESTEQMQKRKPLREAFQKITNPVLQTIITPFVNQQYPNHCGTKKKGRNCTPCYSLVRRYIEGQRQSHAPHRDGHALVTVVVSLSDYGTDYRGGLYVASETSQPYHVALNKGDAVIHQSDLLHGVRVINGDNHENGAERWSWILWYMDSDTCSEDYGYEWFRECASEGNPTCESLHSTKVAETPGLSQEQQQQQILMWNVRAAKHGHPMACVKLARAYLHKLPSALPYNRKMARTLYRNAVRSSNDPDAHYGLAAMLLEEAKKYHNKDNDERKESFVKRAIAHLEAAAFCRHPFSMFNLGIVHVYGYGYDQGYGYGPKSFQHDPKLAQEWFEASGLPEGFVAASMYWQSIGDTETATKLQKRAETLGFGTPWRVVARMKTGSGGASGVDLNLDWPPNLVDQIPPQW